MSNLNKALDDLLNAFAHGFSNGERIVVLGHPLTENWNVGTLKTFTSEGLISPYKRAQSTICSGCEEQCIMEVQWREVMPNNKQALIVCDVPEKQSMMGIISLDNDVLKQWSSDTKQLTEWVKAKLGLTTDTKTSTNGQTIRLGMLKSTKGRRWINFHLERFTLEVNQHHLPLSELIYIDGQTITLDIPSINDKLNDSSVAPVLLETAKASRLEQRKLETLARHQQWQDEYERLKTRHPSHSKTWYAKKIAKLPCANDRDAETIRRVIRN